MQVPGQPGFHPERASVSENEEKNHMGTDLAVLNRAWRGGAGLRLQLLRGRGRKAAARSLPKLQSVRGQPGNRQDPMGCGNLGGCGQLSVLTLLGLHFTVSEVEAGHVHLDCNIKNST